MRLIEANLVGIENKRLKLNQCRLTKGANEIGWLTFEAIGQPTSYTQRLKYHLYDGTYTDVFWLDSLQYDENKNITKYKAYDVNGVIAQRIVAYDGLIEDYGLDTDEPMDDIIYNILLNNYSSPLNQDRSVLKSHSVSLAVKSKGLGDIVTFNYGWQNGLKAIQEVWKASNGRVNILPIWSTNSKCTIYIYIDYHKDRTIFSNNPLVLSQKNVSKRYVESNYSKEINTAYAMSNRYASGYRLGAVITSPNNKFRIEGYVNNSRAATVGELAVNGQELIYRNRAMSQDVTELILNEYRLGIDYNIGTSLSVRNSNGFDQNVIRGLDIVYLSELKSKEVRARFEKFRQSGDALSARTYGATDSPSL